MSWVVFTLFAAFLQSIRTAGQKKMASELNALSASWSRYGFGLPIALVYLALVYGYLKPDSVQLSRLFWLYLIIASVAQLIATLLLVIVLNRRNFASATTYAKTEALLAALVALIFFNSSLSWLAWLAICLGFLGVFFVSLQKSQNANQPLEKSSIVMGLLSGLCFAFTAVFVRRASMELTTPTLFSAALILTLSLFIQGAICSLLLHRQDRGNWLTLKQHARLGWFIGITGAVGSIGWFTAFALKEAAIVKTLGQVEFIFTVFLTYHFFKERIQRYEWIGITLVIMSILILFKAA